MEREQLYEKLTEILRDVFDDDDLIAHAALTASEVDGWDSFAHLRLIYAAENAFGIGFSASEVSRLENLGQLADAIANKS